MKQFYSRVIQYRKAILLFFVLLFLIAALCQRMVSVNYDMNDYLPDDSPSTTALDIMEQEFDGDIPNARIMVADVSIAEALDYKEKLEAIDGVTSVTWLDDAVNIRQPLELYDQDTVETYYKDNKALFTVAIKEEKQLPAVNSIRHLIGEDNAMTGSAVSTAIATTSTISEIQKIAVFAVLFVLLVLLLTTTS